MPVTFALTTLLLREHNRCCDELAPDWGASTDQVKDIEVGQSKRGVPWVRVGPRSVSRNRNTQETWLLYPRATCVSRIRSM